jgi:transposase InsO family protein
VPKAITVDNGTQFDAETFKVFCDQIGTKIHFALVRHPESNGLVERANVSHPGFKEQSRGSSYMRQEDNIYNNRVYRDKCHNNIRVFIT